MEGLVKEGSLGEILFKSRIITEAELRAALESQKKSGCRVGEALVRLGVVTQEDIDWALAHQLNIPYVRLKKENIDPSAVARVPAQLARRYQVMPLVLSGDELSVAIADPLNKDAIEAIAEVSGCQVTISVGLIREIREMQDAVYGADSSPVSLGFSSSVFPPKVLEPLNLDLSCTTLLNRLLLYVVQHKCNTLALQPLGDTVVAAVRTAGRTAEIGRLPAAQYGRLLERMRKLSKMEPCDRSSRSGRLLFLWQGKKIPFQVLMLRASGGDYVTINLHVSPPPVSELSELEIPRPKMEDLAALTRVTEGLVIFAMRDTDERCRFMDLFLDSCQTEGKTVLCIGEGLGRGSKRFPRVPVSREGGDDARFLIGAALQHDPDVLVVEDATDVGAFLAASKAVMRGKLVIAGFSVADKAGALRQLLYLRQKNYLIPSQLRGLVCCKAVLTLCPECKERYTPQPGELAALRLPAANFPFFKPTGCPACDHTGYAGRRYLLDVLRFDAALLDAFEVLRESSEIVRFLKDNGYRGITEEGIEMLEKGEIAPGEFVAAILL